MAFRLACFNLFSGSNTDEYRDRLVGVTKAVDLQIAVRLVRLAQNSCDKNKQ